MSSEEPKSQSESKSSLRSLVPLPGSVTSFYRRHDAAHKFGLSEVYPFVSCKISCRLVCPLLRTFHVF
jgi:hypothetical protein